MASILSHFYKKKKTFSTTLQYMCACTKYLVNPYQNRPQETFFKCSETECFIADFKFLFTVISDRNSNESEDHNFFLPLN